MMTINKTRMVSDRVDDLAKLSLFDGKRRTGEADSPSKATFLASSAMLHVPPSGSTISLVVYAVKPKPISKYYTSCSTEATQHTSMPLA